jgi:hypothetical protein
MLMEELFARGVMKMGPSRSNPTNQVGTFNPEFMAGLQSVRAAEMEKVGWLAGEWNYENAVPATSKSPAYVETGTGRYSLCEKDAWICIVAPTGAEMRHITFDPFSREWFYVLSHGAFCVLRSREGWVDGKIAFTGTMMMLGVECDWRMRWTKHSNDAFSFVNEERAPDGSWAYVDEWRFTRKA